MTKKQPTDDDDVRRAENAIAEVLKPYDAYSRRRLIEVIENDLGYSRGNESQKDKARKLLYRANQNGYDDWEVAWANAQKAITALLQTATGVRFDG